MPSAALPVILLPLMTRPSSATSAHIPTPRLALITLLLTVPDDRVDLMPPDSQSATQNPSVLFSLITLRVMVAAAELYWPRPSWPLWWMRFFSTRVWFALTSMTPTAWFQRTSFAVTFHSGPETSAPACGAEAKCSMVSPRTTTPVAPDSIAVAVFDISTLCPVGSLPTYTASAA